MTKKKKTGEFISFRASPEVRKQIDRLSKFFGENQSAVIHRCIERVTAQLESEVYRIIKSGAPFEDVIKFREQERAADGG